MSLGIAVSCGAPESTAFSMPTFTANEKQASKFCKVLAVTLALIVLACTIPVFSHADSEHALTELFTTTAFSGSWAVFSKFNWLGKLLNFFITMFCLLGLVLTVFRITITLLYKSNEAIFDQIHDLKSHGKGNKFFGIPAIGQELFQGNYGTGLDVIVGFVLSLAPDVKAYSDYNPDKPMYNLEESDTITTYILKISIPTIMTILFFTLGFSGTLWQAYGNVVDALAVAAKKVVQVDLAGYVNKALNAGAYYSFAFDTSNEFGAFQEDLAKNIYNKMLLKMEDIDTASMQRVGSSIEQWVNKNVTIDVIDKKLNAMSTSKTLKQDLGAAANLTQTVDVNTTAEDVGKSSTCVSFSPNIGTFGVTSNKQYYVHVTITKKANADETQYFAVGKGGNTKDKPTTQDKRLNQ